MDDAPPPPVPAIPESVNMAAARARGARPKSLGFVNPPVKTASQRMAEKDKGGSWFGAAKVGDMGNVRTSDAIMRTPSTRTTASAQPVPESPQHDEGRPESRGSSSINFSYPARVRVASPSPDTIEEESTQTRPAAPIAAPKPKKRSSTLSPQRGGSVRSARPASIASDRELVYDPNSRRMVPRADLESFEPHKQPSAEQKPKKKKGALGRAGSHLARGTMGRARGSAVDNGVPNEAQMAAAASLKSHRAEERQSVIEQPEEYYEEEPEAEPAPKPQRQRQAESQPQTRKTVISTSPASNAPEVFSPPLPDQHEVGLQRKPSTVREESEGSDSENELEAPANAAAALDAVPVRQSVYAHGVPSPPQSENTDDQAPAELAAISRISPEPIMEKPEPRETKAIRRESRAQSNSPVRNAHFGTVQETLTVKHEPPVRSLSPRKSALKRSPSRGTSPVGDRSDVSGVDTLSQEPPPPRKKSVRVSFDDENTVVVGEAAGRGETDSPVPPSPQQAVAGGRKPWYNTLGIGRKKGPVPLEDDEVMKPRPALPSFGSVRTRKVSPTLTEGRALVRPHDPLEEVSETSSPELERRKFASDEAGQSSDHALGAIISDQNSRTGANISKQREPLPPVVTSMEGNGLESDSSSSEDEAAMMADTPKLPTEESIVSQASTLVSPRIGSAAESTNTEAKDFGAKHETVPSFSLTQPSPQPEKQGTKRNSYLQFPGGFPETASESEDEDATPPARQATFEPIVQAGDATATAHTPATVLATQTPIQDELEKDTDENSIYSDAYEDLSDADGDGFLSLDAVVDSPIITTPPRHVLEKAHAQRSGSTTPTPQPRQLEGSSDPSEPVDEWAAAKAYWRSLTADKRAQLEKEAADEAGTEADLEDVQQPEAKPPRRKKSVEKRTAEKRVIEQQRAMDPSRTYMIQPGTKAGSINSDASPRSKSFASREPQQQQLNGKSADGGTRLRKTVRTPTEPQPAESGTHFRKSMRAGSAPQIGDNGGHMRKSMRSAPNEPPAPRQRPVSHQPLGSKNEITNALNKNRHTRTMSEHTPTPAAARLIQPSALRRQNSDSSASSFRRARQATSGGGFGFRRTMRGGTGGGALDVQQSTRSQSQLQQRDASSRFSLRATSPPVTMRATLRGERRRSDDSGKGYLRFPGRKSSEKKSGKLAMTSSRFGDDSSDDDEAVGSRRAFTSRFDDSSDEDLTPTKPLPSLNAKTMRAGRNKAPPSPPLPEEEEISDAETPVVVGAIGDEKAPGVTSARSGSGMDVGKRQRRGSFLSSVLRRNKKHDGGAKITRPELMDSAARRDTTLERSPDELSALRTGGNSPKLHKRIASMPITTVNTTSVTSQQQPKDWPLTPTAAAEADDDKDVFYDAADGQDGDGVGSSPSQQRSPSVLAHSKSQPSMLMTRPGFLTRRTTTGSVATAVTLDGGVAGSVNGERGKKKKFSALRRMFRLDE